MQFEEAVAKAPPGWRHFTIADIARLPDDVRDHAMAGVPPNQADDRVVRALFWTFVYHLEPERWDALAGSEPIHPAVIDALPRDVPSGLDVGAGSGRLTQHLVPRCRRVTAVEPSRGLRALLAARLPQVRALHGWAEALPLDDAAFQLTCSCASIGPDPAVLAELRRVTAGGGLIALINPEQPDWFEANGWRRFTAPPMAAPPHAPWIDDFFGPPDPPRELLTLRV